MTLQERMIQAYLRQSELPQSEKEKLKLFLVLLDETYREEGEETASREGKSENQTLPPRKNQTTQVSDDPFARSLLSTLEKLGLQADSKEAEQYFRIRQSVLVAALEGKPVRKDSRARILQRMQDAGIADME